MEALSYSMATRGRNCIPGLPLEIRWLVERVRKRMFHNNFFHRHSIAEPESTEPHEPVSMTGSEFHWGNGIPRCNQP